jgi:hypothetical protein
MPPMWRTRCELSGRDKIRAFWQDDGLMVLAQGALPTPGYDVEINQSPLPTARPEYFLQRCPRPGVWPDVVSPFTYSERFPLDARPDTVVVHHADGADQIPVEAGWAPVAGTAPVAGAPEQIAGPDEVTGYSKSLSFDEAFADAMLRLPTVTKTVADQLETIEVVRFGAEFGGFIGAHHLSVTIRRTLH